jgi:hypothetical protein
MSKKVSAADVIRDGIGKGFGVDKILRQVSEKVQTSNADASHVAYYAKVLHSKGLIEVEARDKYVISRRDPKASKPAKTDATTKLKKSSKTKLGKLASADAKPGKVKKSGKVAKSAAPDEKAGKVAKVKKVKKA